MFVTKKEVKETVDEAEKAFRECWDLFEMFKEEEISKLSTTDILSFQPRLAQAIYDLSVLFRRIESEKKDRISRKDTFSADWFRRRMRLLGFYQQVLNKAISIGRTIGDGFAWLFYAGDQRYLRKHLAEPRPLHAPPGIGGAGELGFIQGTQMLHEYLLLYHGITNMLRLGDLSIIDIQSRTVVGIGELKSRAKGSDSIEITVLLSGPGKALQLPKPAKPADNRTKFYPGLSRKGEARLARQLDRIGKSFEELGRRAEKNLTTQSPAHFSALSDLLNRARVNEFCYGKAGRSVVLAACRFSRSSLYGRLTRTPNLALDKMPEQLTNEVEGIVNPGANDNSLFVDFLIYDRRGHTAHLPGMMHPIWWPIDAHALRALIFLDVLVLTIWNPSHLRADLVARGFKVEGTFPARWRVYKDLGNRKMEIGGMQYFTSMVQHYLQGDETIASIFGEMEKALPPDVIQGKMDMHIEQQVWGPERQTKTKTRSANQRKRNTRSP